MQEHYDTQQVRIDNPTPVDFQGIVPWLPSVKFQMAKHVKTFSAKK